MTEKCACNMTLNEIKADHFDRLKTRRVVMLEDTGSGWRVHDWTENCVAPTFETITIQAALDAAESIAVRHRRSPVTKMEEGGEVVTDPHEILKAFEAASNRTE